MSTTTPSGLLPGPSLLNSAGLTFPQIYEYAIENLGNDYVSAACKLYSQLSGSEERSGNLKVQVYRYGIKFPFASIAKRTTSGTNLVLQFAQEYDQYRPGDVLRAKSEAQGTVIAVGTGQVTIAPYGQTSFASTDFVEEEVAGWQGNLQPQDGGNSVNRIINMPIPYYNVIEQQRESVQMGMNETWIKTFLNDPSGQPYYLRTSQRDAMQRLMFSICKRLYTGVRIEGNVNEAGGAIWQVKNQGGVYKPFYDSLSETELMDMVGEINKKGGMRDNELAAFWGYGYSQMFGFNIGKQYIQTAGTNNVLGGSKVTGLNINNYAVGGYRLAGIRDWFLDAPGIFAEEGFSTVNGQRTRSNSAFYFDPSKCETDGGQMKPVMNYYFGNAGMMYWNWGGGTNVDGSKNSNPSNGTLIGNEEFHYTGMYQLTQPQRHGYHFLGV